MADFPRIQLSKIGWDVNPSREGIYAQQSPDAIRYDFSDDIEKAVRQVALSITTAQDDKIKSLFEECWDAGAENNGRGGPPYSTNFEQWWDTLVARLREELDES